MKQIGWDIFDWNLKYHKDPKRNKRKTEGMMKQTKKQKKQRNFFAKIEWGLQFKKGY